MLSESRISPTVQESAEAAARRLLREIAAALAAQRERLVAAHDAVPVSPRADVMLLGEETVDFPTEARRTIECALIDHLDPLIQALREAAEYSPEGADDRAKLARRLGFEPTTDTSAADRFLGELRHTTTRIRGLYNVLTQREHSS